MNLFIDEKEAVKGQEVTCRDGEKAILVGWTEPHKISSSGFVHVKFKDGFVREYYAGVIGGKIK